MDRRVGGVYRFGPPHLWVGDMARISRFYHDYLSCWFFDFASCLSNAAKLISLL